MFGESSGLVLCEKPSIGSVAPTKLTDRSRFGNDGTWTAITAKQLPSGLWVSTYNGTTSKIAIGNIGQNIQTVCAWIYPDDITTRSIVDLDGGTHSIEMDGSGDITATGWTSPTFYTDAVAAAVAITLSGWNFIAVTTATPFAGSSVTLGDEASFFDGDSGIWKIYNRALSAGEILQRFNQERHLFGV